MVFYNKFLLSYFGFYFPITVSHAGGNAIQEGCTVCGMPHGTWASHAAWASAFATPW